MDVLPKIWKESIIVPIHKQGKPKTHIGSYRPIALTSHVCKLLEKIMLNRLVYYCEKNNVIPVNQAGLKKKKEKKEDLQVIIY